MDRTSKDADTARVMTAVSLDESPPAAAALGAAAAAVERMRGIEPLIHAALAPQIAAALAAWRADPTWADHIAAAYPNVPLMVVPVPAIRMRSRQIAALRDDPAALHDAVTALRDAVTILLRDDDPEVATLCLNALGAAGWAALEADQRNALLTLASPGDLGWIWGALDEKQRTAAVHAALHAPQVLEDTAAQRLAAQARAAAEAWTEEAQRARSREAAANLLLAADKVRQAALFAEDSAPLSRAKAVRAAESAAETALSASASKRAKDATRAVESWARRLRRRLFDATSDVQQTETARAVGRLIERIGADGWKATSPELRERLIDAVVQIPLMLQETAPVWSGMTAAERARLATAVIEQNNVGAAFVLLRALGRAGRATLTGQQRAALESLARNHDPWRVLEMRAADGGWTALNAKERRAVLAAARRDARRVSGVLRAVGAAGWNVMRADDQARLAAAVRRTPDAFFRCPPALWAALGGDDPSPPRAMSRNAADHWNAEDADADLGGLPPAHQAVALALAPWRTADATKDSARMQRLLAAWNALTVDARVALATAHPSMLATVAAAARRRADASEGVDAVGETLIRIVLATGGEFDARQAAGRLMRAAPRWRNWMASFAPTDDDLPETWAAWRAAARRGIVLDPSLCARLAAPAQRPSAARRAQRRP